MENNMLIYQDENGITKVSVRLDEDDIWLTQNQIAELYNTTKQNISLHINNIFNDGELSQNSTVKKYLTVQNEGGRKVNRNLDHYNLDMIIALGYRIQSPVAVRFRQWATQRLHEYIQKGFTIDDERLKQGGNRYFRELLQRIRDNRVDNEKPFVGMTNFKGNYVTRDDVKIAKNYLSEIELQRLNLLVSQFLDYAEFQALEQRSMTMQDWSNELDNQIIANHRRLLEGKGTVSHKQAIEKAEKEFEVYREREMKTLESDFDKAIKKLKD